MDFLTVSTAAYFGATLMSLLLFGALLVQGRGRNWKRALAVGALCQTLWLGSLSYSYLTSSASSQVLLTLEVLHFCGWMVAFALVLGGQHTGIGRRFGFKALVSLCVLVSLFTLYQTLFNFSTNIQVLSLLYALLAALTLVSLEQLLRNIELTRFMKLTGACLFILFVFDIFLYSQAFVEGQPDPFVWQSRAALIMGASFSIAAGSLILSDDGRRDAHFSVSRPAAFYSTSIVLSGLLIGLVGGGGYYVRLANGYWGTYLFTLMMFFGLLVFAALFLSRSFRRSVEVFIGKHFFRHKFDYRQEWLRIIRYLSQDIPEAQFYTNTYQVLASVFQNTTGSLWLTAGHQLRPVFQTHDDPSLPSQIAVQSPFLETMLEEDWVYSPRSNGDSLTQFNHRLPHWVHENKAIWLIVPLISQSTLVGMVILNQPSKPHEPSWEDLDLLKTIGRQLASHLLLHEQAKELREAQQFDTYNKLTAFIMHDMNNVIAQLDLIERNAQRHKTNPAFIDDMIKTVHNSVQKMRVLIQKFGQGGASQASDFSLREALGEVLDACSSNLPEPTLVWQAEDAWIHADRDRLIQTIEHLVSNAQDATDDVGNVSITVCSNHYGDLDILIEDTGEGMTADFIKNQLFRPFETTKQGRGMGIGAYLSRSYIRQLGGDMDIQSEPGHGTRVRISLTPSLNARTA